MPYGSYGPSLSDQGIGPDGCDDTLTCHCGAILPDEPTETRGPR